LSLEIHTSSHRVPQRASRGTINLTAKIAIPNIFIDFRMIPKATYRKMIKFAIKSSEGHSRRVHPAPSELATGPCSMSQRKLTYFKGAVHPKMKKKKKSQ